MRVWTEVERQQDYGACHRGQKWPMICSSVGPGFY